MAEKLTNTGFENWSSATNLDDWTETISGTGTITRSTEASVGTYSCRIYCEETFHSARIYQDVTLSTSTPYLFSIGHMATIANKQISVAISDTGENVSLYQGGWITYAGANHHEITSSTDWGNYYLPFVTHSSYTDYRITIGKYTGAQESYIDTVSVVDTLIDHESDGIELADAGGSGRQSVYDSVSVKDDFKYYLASSEGKIFTYSGDYLSDDGSVILSRWRSKTLDFADQIPECADGFKELTGVKLIYKDITTDTNVTIYVSTDGGQTWEHETKILGTGSGQILSANYHFIKTGEYFILAIEHASTDKEFMWLHMEADVVPLGTYFEI